MISTQKHNTYLMQKNICQYPSRGQTFQKKNARNSDSLKPKRNPNYRPFLVYASVNFARSLTYSVKISFEKEERTARFVSRDTKNMQTLIPSKPFFLYISKYYIIYTIIPLSLFLP